MQRPSSDISDFPGGRKFYLFIYLFFTGGLFVTQEDRRVTGEAFVTRPPSERRVGEWREAACRARPL